MKAKFYHPIAILVAVLLAVSLLDGGQTPLGGLRIMTPQDGATVEPGQRFSVAVEVEKGVTPATIAIISNPIFTSLERPPFSFSVAYPSDIALGPKKLIADGVDTKDRPLRAEITLHVETSTPVKNIQVTDPPLFISTEREISVYGVFADGVKREITRSREIRYTSSNIKVVTVAADGLIEAIDNGTATITMTYKNQSFSFPVKVASKKLSVPIDVRPESPRNVVNLASKGRLPVAIFSTRDFDATKIRPDTVRFGPNRAKPVVGGGDDRDDEPDNNERDEKGRRRGRLGHTEDINGDRLPDLLLHFRIQDIGFTCADTQATLTGFTLRRERISGSDAVQPIGPGCR